MDPKNKGTDEREARKDDEARDDDIADVHASETSDDRILGGMRRPWRDDELRATPARGRHDQGYIPKGYARRGDMLVRLDAPREMPALGFAEDKMPAEDRALVGAVVEGLGVEGAWAVSEIAGALSPKVRAACEALFDVLYGCPCGEGWQAHLAELLREQAEIREAERIGVNVLPHSKVRTPAEILGLLREQYVTTWMGTEEGNVREISRQRVEAEDDAPPSWLSADVIEAAIESINLGGAGGRGKKGGRSPEQAVRWIVDQATRKPRR